MIRSTVQFVSSLVAAILGELVRCRLIGFPSLSHPRLLVGLVFWSAAILAYLIPRSVTRRLGVRILASFLVLAALAVARAWLVGQLSFSGGRTLILAPLPALAVLYIALFLTEPPRAARTFLAVLFVTVLVQFLAMWWSYGFDQDLALNQALPPVIPLMGMTVALLATDNLLSSKPEGKRVPRNQ